MEKPVYEIPVNGGLNDVTPTPPPGVGPTPPPNYGPPPGTAALDAPPPTGAPTSYASAPPPAAPAAFAPPAMNYATPASAFSDPETLFAPPTPNFTVAPPAEPQPAAPLFETPAGFGPPPVVVAPEPQLKYPEPSVAFASYAIPSVPVDDTFDADTAPRLGADADLIAALHQVLMAGASDLHVSAGAPPMIRIDGILRPIEGAAPWERHKVTSALYSIMNEQQQELFERELELDFAFTLAANARFRVNFYQQRGAVGGAFRLIPVEIKQLRDLGVPASVAQFAKLARGLVLITGPTGSGKSTTLAALIDLVNRTRADHIVTIEDPIEFLHQNHRSLVNQREVGSDTHSFAGALKHVLRQDPDVILVGELRDLETIQVALTAAETGHLVFATLHTQDAPQTVDRVVDVFPPHQQNQIRAQLAATLQGVVTQTLVRSASGSGRVVATEVMFMTPAVANMIREGKTYQIHSAMQAGRDLGMHTLDQNLAELVNEGRITHQAALERVKDLDSFTRLVRRTPEGTFA